MAKTSARIQQLHVEREILENQKKHLYSLVGQFLQQRATGTLEAAMKTKQEVCVDSFITEYDLALRTREFERVRESSREFERVRESSREFERWLQ
jgi:hypothetical protein